MKITFNDRIRFSGKALYYTSVVIPNPCVTTCAHFAPARGLM
jgi:hypothetical protein